MDTKLQLSEPSRNDALSNGLASSFHDWTFSRDAWGRLQLIGADGVNHPNVVLAPLFPLTDPAHWIAVREPDGREIVCIEDPQQLSAESRAVLTDELARREFRPVIHRILHVSGKAEPTEWHVETDRGTTRFVLASDEQVRRLGDDKVSIVDANGVRYLIEDVRALDAKSRRVIEWYV
jgi:hypothetical protein